MEGVVVSCIGMVFVIVAFSFQRSGLALSPLANVLFLLRSDSHVSVIACQILSRVRGHLRQQGGGLITAIASKKISLAYGEHLILKLAEKAWARQASKL